jgi:hypothetical protein
MHYANAKLMEPNRNYKNNNQNESLPSHCCC